MTDVDKAVIARYKSGKEIFEVLVDCEKSLDFRGGRTTDVSEALVVEQVFKDAKKGERAKEESMKEVFGTSDLKAVCAKIVKEGEVQLTAEYRKKKVEEKKKVIMAKILKEGVDPRTGRPVPPQRLENAFETAGVKIAPHLSVAEQMPIILKKIAPVLPIKFEKKVLELKIPARFAGPVYSYIRSLAKPKKENWLPNGAYSCIIELSPGDAQELVEYVEKSTHGVANIKYLE